jgi:hypothetical protein
VLYLLAICGIEGSADSDSRWSQLSALRRHLGPRPNGGPLGSLGASVPSMTSLLHLPPATEEDNLDPGATIPALLVAANGRQAASSFILRCREAAVGVPVLPEHLRKFIRRIAPEPCSGLMYLPLSAWLPVAATLAWAHRTLGEPRAWAALKDFESRFLLACGGIRPPDGPVHFAACLLRLRLRLLACDAQRSRWPD